MREIEQGQMRVDTSGSVVTERVPEGDFLANAQEVLAKRENGNSRLVRGTFHVSSDFGDAVVAFEQKTPGGSILESKRVRSRDVLPVLMAKTRELYAEYPETEGLQPKCEVLATQDGQMAGAVSVLTENGKVLSVVTTSREKDERGYNAVGQALLDGYEAALTLVREK